MNRPLEQRTTRGTVEFRAPKPGKKMPGMTGYMLKYNRLSQNLGGFVEQVLPGAADKSIADKVDVLIRQHHLDTHLLARTGAGTAEVVSDKVGVQYIVDELPDTTVGRDLAVQLERRDIQHSSFAFFTIEDDWGTTEQGFPLRSLVAMQLVDGAPVVTPAYLDTSAAVRSLAARLDVDPNEIPSLAERNEIVRRLTAPTIIDLGERVLTKSSLEVEAPAEPDVTPEPEATPEPAAEQAPEDASTAVEEKSAPAQGESHAAADLRARRLALLARRTF